jgi:hypothetical protein
LVNESKEETLRFLKTLTGNQMDDFRTIENSGVKGNLDWVVEQEREFMKQEGFPYQRKVVEWIIKKNDLSLTDIETKGLGTMVYFATDIIHRQDDEKSGWLLSSEFDLEELANNATTMEIKSDLSGAIKGKIIRVTSSTEHKAYGFLPTGKKKRGYGVTETTLLRKA